MDTVRIGIIGSGFMGLTHAEAFSKYIPGARLVAIAGGTHVGELAARYGVAGEPGIGALLERQDVDAVVLTTPHAVHAEETIAAAREGKHVLVEKPMAVSVQECDAMIEACRQAGVNLMVAQTQRFRQANLLAKRLVDEGHIGRVVMLRETQMGRGGIAAFPSWQSDPSNVGLLIGHGIHNLDRMRWMSGSEAISVTARVGAWTETSSVDVSAMLLVEFRSGAVGTFWMSWEVPAPGFPNSEFRAWIMGDGGLLDIDGYGKLQLGTRSGWETVYEQPPIDYRGNKLDPVRMASYADQGQEFVDSILQGRRPSVAGEDGRAAVEIAEAAYRSSQTGQAVRLPLQR